MQEIIESLEVVVTTGGFLYNMSMIIVVGIIAGVKLNEYLVGFKRSLVILIPFIVVLLFSNTTRIMQIAQTTEIGHNAYNGSITIILTSICYMLGLFLGHVTFHKAKRDAESEINDTRSIYK